MVTTRQTHMLPGTGAQDRRKVNRIAGDSNAHRIKDILPDDIAVKCLPISDENIATPKNGRKAKRSRFCSPRFAGESLLFITFANSVFKGAKFSCDRFRHALLRDLRKMDVQQLYLHLGSNDILTNEAVFYRDVADLCDLVHQEAHNRCPECRVVCSNEDALLSHFCSREIKQPETGKENVYGLYGFGFFRDNEVNVVVQYLLNNLIDFRIYRDATPLVAIHPPPAPTLVWGLTGYLWHNSGWSGTSLAPYGITRLVSGLTGYLWHNTGWSGASLAPYGITQAGLGPNWLLWNNTGWSGASLATYGYNTGWSGASLATYDITQAALGLTGPPMA
ncbi:hypothetical protein DPMN_162427 [Dreissena polymorpha]|uniref:Uncharacterized protein n=1 Tax=Dreissena polymorpha TaxID=45954 RepID=A0A9D4EV26_DREPO|nr:hypothetical protein DPMN_162427 [Dreissena polymorpha]